MTAARRGPWLAAVLVAVLASLAAAGPASAQRGGSPPCPGVAAWAAACAAKHDLDVRVVFCPSGGAVLSVQPRGHPPVRIEIARGRRDAFTTVAGLGVSPVAEYEDWGRAPAPVRETFERVVACVRDDPSLSIAGTLAPTGGAREEAAAPVRAPWLGLLGAALALGLAVTRNSRRGLATAVRLLALTAATATVRLAVWPLAFAHQNGQGPLWIAHALGAPSVYGPGYAEVFGAVARLGSSPDRAVFVAQALLGSLVPAAVWLVARGAGARSGLAWPVAVAAAVDPGLGRLGGSESYFGTCGALLALSAAVLSVAVRRARVRDLASWLGLLSAGALAAQAVWIHPVAAVPAAALPVVALVGCGSLRARGRVALAAVLVVGVVASSAFVAAFGDLTGGELGRRWAPSFWQLFPGQRVRDVALVALPLWVGVVAASRRRGRGAVRAAAVVAVVAAGAGTYLLGPVPPVIELGYAQLFLGPAVAALAACAAGLRLPRRAPRALVPAVVALAAVAAAALRAGEYRVLPTDVREQDLVLRWRTREPPVATLAFLGVAGDRRLFLPAHGAWRAGTPVARQLDAAAPPPDLEALGPGTHYYRSSLCASGEGRRWCDDLERQHGLVRVESATLPALPSMGGHEYLTPEVDVVLFRVEAPPEG